MKCVALIFCTCLIFSCDVPGIIEVDNSSGNEILYIMLKQQKDQLDTIRLIVPDEEKRKLILGFGTKWTDAGIREFLSTVENIQVLTQNDTLLMTDKKEMYNYFRERRKGLSKKTIEIKIE